MKIKKIIAVVLCAFMLPQSLTACTIKLKNDGQEEKEKKEEEKYEDRITTDRNETEENEEIEETDETEENGGFFEEAIADTTDMGEIYSMTGMTNMTGITSMTGIDITLVPFTPRRIVGLEPDWSWAVVEIGWNDYSGWPRYADLFDDEEEFWREYEEQFKETPPPTTTETEPEPPPPTIPPAESDPAYYAEPDMSMPFIETEEWPTAYLPPGLPVYPGSDIKTAGSPRYIHVEIKNSSTASFSKYIEALENAGWVFDENSSSEIFVMGSKGLWHVICGCQDGTTVMLQFEYN